MRRREAEGVIDWLVMSHRFHLKTQTFFPLFTVSFIQSLLIRPSHLIYLYICFKPNFQVGGLPKSSRKSFFIKRTKPKMQFVDYFVGRLF